MTYGQYTAKLDELNEREFIAAMADDYGTYRREMAEIEMKRMALKSQAKKEGII